MQKESYEQTSKRINEELWSVRPDELAGFFDAHREELITSLHPFADYMRRKIKEKGVLQQNVFLAADLSENYGYKLIAEEKHTRQRDTILRLCLAARFRPEEVQEALILYGMAPLHGRFPRDAVLIVAIQNGVYDMREVNALLESCGQPPLVKDYE
ncbi:MAG: hypothetical protein IJ179_08900 [Oscillospiraceae bacterium]|nr:hypothetical protein [Oscillospiraceae bacterium]